MAAAPPTAGSCVLVAIILIKQSIKFNYLSLDFFIVKRFTTNKPTTRITMLYVAFAPRLLFVKYAPITNINPPINRPIRFFQLVIIASYFLFARR